MPENGGFDFWGNSVSHGTAPDIGAHEYQGSPTGAITGQASGPDPSDRATNVSLDTQLNWSAAAGATSHDAYFGTGPGHLQLVTTTTQTRLSPGP